MKLGVWRPTAPDHHLGKGPKGSPTPGSVSRTKIGMRRSHDWVVIQRPCSSLPGRWPNQASTISRGLHRQVSQVREVSANPRPRPRGETRTNRREGAQTPAASPVYLVGRATGSHGGSHQQHHWPAGRSMRLVSTRALIRPRLEGRISNERFLLSTCIGKSGLEPARRGELTKQNWRRAMPKGGSANASTLLRT